MAKLKPQSWMTSPQTRKLMRALSHGATARFVGGAVRDALLRRAVKDVDIAIDVKPEETMALLRRAKIRAIPTGIDHGTVTAVIGGRHFEITSLRRDVATDGRRATVAYTDNWLEDAERRDFTMNAMYADADGTLFDPVNGEIDARKGAVRFVGDPAERIREDYLRILRLFRFFAHYGRRKPDAAALKACRDLAQGMDQLSGERVRDEFLKLLSAADPAPALDLMKKNKILPYILPGIKNWKWLLRFPLRDGSSRLMALLAENKIDPQIAARRLKLSNADRDRFAAAVKTQKPPADKNAEIRAIYGNGAALHGDLLALWVASGSIGKKDFQRRAKILRAFKPRVFPIKGADLLALGIAPGPQFGALLKKTEQWWIKENFKPTRKQVLAKLRQLAGLA